MLYPEPRQPWTPQNLAGLSLWLDASDARALGLSSGVVDTWRDKSGNGRDFTGSSTARPAWSADGLATGKAGITFDGTDDILTRAEAWMYGAGAGGLFVVCKAPSVGTQRSMISEGSTGSNTPTINWFRSGATATDARTLWTDDAGVNQLANTPSRSNGFTSSPIQMSRVDTGTSMLGRNNGTQHASPTYTRSTTTLNTTAIGAQARATPTAFWAGTISEIVFVGRPMVRREYEQVEGYLCWKWGITQNADAPWQGTFP